MTSDDNPALARIREKFAESAGRDLGKALNEAEREYQEYIEEKNRREVLKKRIVRIVIITTSVITGYLLDRICVAIGIIPKEWLFGNILRSLWHRIFD